jgi:hypothetical protein
MQLRADLWLLQAARPVFRSLQLQAANPTLKPAATTCSPPNLYYYRQHTQSLLLQEAHPISATTGSPPDLCYYRKPTRSLLLQAAHAPNLYYYRKPTRSLLLQEAHPISARKPTRSLYYRKPTRSLLLQEAHPISASTGSPPDLCYYTASPSDLQR